MHAVPRVFYSQELNENVNQVDIKMEKNRNKLSIFDDTIFSFIYLFSFVCRVNNII